jgi:hypothetical protein
MKRIDSLTGWNGKMSRRQMLAGLCRRLHLQLAQPPKLTALSGAAMMAIISSLCGQARRYPNFSIFSGEDALASARRLCRRCGHLATIR